MKISYMKEYEWYVQYVYIYALLLTEYQLIDAHILDTEFSSWASNKRDSNSDPIEEEGTSCKLLGFCKLIHWITQGFRD